MISLCVGRRCGKRSSPQPWRRGTRRRRSAAGTWRSCTTPCSWRTSASSTPSMATSCARGRHLPGGACGPELVGRGRALFKECGRGRVGGVEVTLTQGSGHLGRQHSWTCSSKHPGLQSGLVVSGIRLVHACSVTSNSL